MSREEARRERFGTLRSLLARRPAPDFRSPRHHYHYQCSKNAWDDELLVTLRAARALDPRRYDATWVPYLSSFRDTWNEPIRVVTTPEEFEETLTLLPCARCVVRTSTRHIMSFMNRPLALRVTHLVLEHHTLGLQGLRATCQPGALVNLESLELVHGGWGRVSSRMVAKSPLVENLRVLRWGPSLNEATGKEIGRPRIMQTLEILRIGSNHRHRDGVTHALSGDLTRLRRLGVYMDWDAIRVAHIFRHGQLPTLEHLELGNFRVREADVDALMNALKGDALQSIFVHKFESNDVARAVRARLEAEHSYGVELGY